MTGLIQQSVDTIDDIAEWVKARYWYIIEELEASDRNEPQAMQEAPPSDLAFYFICGGRRQEPMTPHQEDEEEAARYRNFHKHGRGRLTEISWKRHAGGGRRGRATVRTMEALAPFNPSDLLSL